jgi:hypothetical protein
MKLKNILKFTIPAIMVLMLVILSVNAISDKGVLNPKIDKSTQITIKHSFNKLDGEWWQWALSIPPSANPVLDTTGQDCEVGQHGDVWFLAGLFGSGTATRTCSIPAGKTVYFPVINSVNINTPNVCGQDANNIPATDLLNLSSAYVNNATNLSANLDGKPVKMNRFQYIFEIALPEDNIFDEPCEAANLGNVPAGIYSPSADDGFYATLPPLDAGIHTLHIHAENPDQAFVIDVTYNLNVVVISLK